MRLLPSGLERWALVVGALRMDHAPAEASEMFEVFDGWAKQALPADHTARALALARWAWCQVKLGDGARACDLYGQALEVLAASAGIEHPASRLLSAYLTDACDGVPDEAGRGPEPPRDLAGLPRFNPMAGPDGLSVPSAEAELTRVKAAVSPDDISAAPFHEMQYVVGKMMAEFGLYEPAQEAFEIYEHLAAAAYGPDHDNVVTTVGELALCHLELGNYSESCRLYERQRQMLARAHADHPYLDVLDRLLEARCPPVEPSWFFGIAAGLADAGELASALGAFAAYQRWVESERGPDHPYAIDTLIGRAHCHSRLGQLDSACSLYQQALDRAEEARVQLNRRDEITAWVSETCRASELPPGDPADYYETWVPPALRLIEPQLHEIGRELQDSGHLDEAASAFAAHEAWLYR